MNYGEELAYQNRKENKRHDQFLLCNVTKSGSGHRLKTCLTGCLRKLKHALTHSYLE